MSHPEQAERLASFRRFDEIDNRGVEWLWPGRLALGKLSLLEGDPGLGKSFLALDLCARLSSGRPWPDGSASLGPAAAVYLNAEDGAEDTLGPRLCALGADPARVYLLDRSTDDVSEMLTLSAQRGVLDELMTRIRPRLLVIDPITPFLGSDINMGSDASVRRGLAPPAELARRHGCAVLLVRHLNKLGHGPALYRGLGSIALVGVCRSAWLVAERHEQPGQRVLAQVKNNLVAPQPALAFEFVEAEAGAPTLRWLGPVADHADDLLASKKRRGQKPEKRNSAQSFLRELLADGPMTSRAIWERVKVEGFSVRTMQRAKRELSIETSWVMENGVMLSYWLLPKQNLPSSGMRPIFPIDERQRSLMEQDSIDTR
jgi:RecA-family ATPase